MKKLFLSLIIWLIRRFMKKPEILGAENIDAGKPTIFVSNHLGYYAPLKLIAYTDFDLIPWIAHEVTDSETCSEYLIRDFIEPDLKLKKPWSNLLAGVLSPLCVLAMNQLQAIPVYYKSRRIFETIELSIKRLEEGRNLLIFPEIAVLDKNVLGEFRDGFIYLAKFYFERSQVLANFYPVSVNKETNQIIIGSRIQFDPMNSIWDEKLRIVSALRNTITNQLSVRA